ncbi:class I SAM-dependent methyltransferase [uncultured Roseobacter sp.]|uniref:class I SAM-dependent methyltransferase n=1 Tax=uncultured Roseobacter sp. TaxID=114847 RepID=UPI002636A8E3|nr:class I SAM-dependent methyltransferase [uncultured Roseobacter sp.]
MTMDNSDQAEFWTEAGGAKWVAQQQALDTFMAPVLEAVLTRADLRPGQRVLDIGCGTGASSLRAAEAVGASGSVLGLDISPTMLARARMRGEGQPNLAFLQADAAEHRFEPGAFDALISRFGVMFFADPVTAFGNIRKALAPGAPLTFAAWGRIEANPWFTTAAQAAKARLGAPPAVDPDAPGPFAFRDPARISALLTKAGFTDVDIEVAALQLTPPGTPEEVARMATSIGPAARTLDHFGGDAADLEAIAAGIQQAFRAFETDEGVRVPAEINFTRARCPTG